MSLEDLKKLKLHVISKRKRKSGNDSQKSSVKVPRYLRMKRRIEVLDEINTEGSRKSRRLNEEIEAENRRKRELEVETLRKKKQVDNARNALLKKNKRKQKKKKKLTEREFTLRIDREKPEAERPKPVDLRKIKVKSISLNSRVVKMKMKQNPFLKLEENRKQMNSKQKTNEELHWKIENAKRQITSKPHYMQGFVSVPQFQPQIPAAFPFQPHGIQFPTFNPPYPQNTQFDPHSPPPFIPPKTPNIHPKPIEKYKPKKATKLASSVSGGPKMNLQNFIPQMWNKAVKKAEKEETNRVIEKMKAPEQIENPGQDSLKKEYLDHLRKSDFHAEQQGTFARPGGIVKLREDDSNLLGSF